MLKDNKRKMASEQYDVSKKMQRLFQEKQKIREAIRHAVLKREGDPYKGPGYLNDPAVVRFHAMLHYRVEHLKPTPRSVISFVGFVVIPILGLAYGLITSHEKKEKLLRSGKLTYEERYFRASL